MTRKSFLITLAASLFIGIMLGGPGTLVVGSLINIAQPAACPGGYIEAGSTRGEWRDAVSGDREIHTNPRHICVPAQGSESDVTAPATGFAMAAYSVIAFLLLLPLARRRARGRKARSDEAYGALARRFSGRGVMVEGHSIDMSGADLATKLEVLASMRNSSMIDSGTYEAKVAEVQAKATRVQPDNRDATEA